MSNNRYTNIEKNGEEKALILEKSERIKAEEERLREQFREIDDSKKEVVNATIKDAAFVTVEMEYLSQSILENGTTIQYKNGENQYGTKQNPDVTLYIKMSQRLSASTKILLDCMPKTERSVKEDGFDEFTDAKD